MEQDQQEQMEQDQQEQLEQGQQQEKQVFYFSVLKCSYLANRVCVFV